MSRIAWVILAALLPSIASASNDSKGTVTVFPFDYRESKVDKGSRIVLEEEVRTLAAELLAPVGYNVLANETQLQLLADRGLDPTRIVDASSSLGAARGLKVTFFVAGVVSASEGHHVAFVRLFRVKDGQQMKSVELEGKDIRQLRDAFKKQSDEFFGVVPGVAATATASTKGSSGTAAKPALPTNLAPVGAFQANDAIVYDPASKLMWQRKVGKKPYDSPPNDYCEHLNIGGTAGWRLPKKEELLSLVAVGEDGPTIDKAAFPGTPEDWFWTASADGIGDFMQVWKVNFGDGQSTQAYVTGASATPGYVRCVR